MMYTYKVKFQLGKMPYYVWVDAANDADAKVAAKKKVRAAYGRKRQYMHLSMENLGEAAPMPADPPVVLDKVGEMVMPGDTVIFEDDKRGVVQFGHEYRDAPDNFYKPGADYLYIDLDDGVKRLVKPKTKYSLDFMVLRESDMADTQTDWIQYNVGDYEKKFYDIKLHHGKVFYGCWPNAGMFHAGDYGYFDESLVGWVRPSELNDIGMPLRSGE